MPEGPVEQRRPSDTQTGAVYRQSTNVETLSGDKELSNTDEQVQAFDAGGAARNVDLPTDAEGLYFEVYNTSDAAEDLTVRDSDDNTVVTVSQNEGAAVRNTGNGWVVLYGNAGSGQEV